MVSITTWIDRDCVRELFPIESVRKPDSKLTATLPSGHSDVVTLSSFASTTLETAQSMELMAVSSMTAVASVVTTIWNPSELTVSGC
jgi:hypothetical protein